MSGLANFTELLAPIVGRVGDTVRAGWEIQRQLQGRKTASILRFTLTGGDPALGMPPVPQRVPGLEDLPVLVRRGAVLEKTAGTATRHPEIEHVFVFQDVQALLGDRVEFEGSIYDVLDVQWNPVTGRCAVTARRSGPS